MRCSFFFTSSSHNKVDHVFLAGGSASLKGLPQEVKAQTQFPCVVVNPFEHMEFSSSLRTEKIAREASTYLTATGLALRRFLQ